MPANREERLRHAVYNLILREKTDRWELGQNSKIESDCSFQVRLLYVNHSLPESLLSHSQPWKTNCLTLFAQVPS